MVITSDLATAQAYSATATLNDVANDPGWGLWFNYNGDSGASDSTQRQSFQAAGISSLSYNESFGDSANPIVELKWSSKLQRWTAKYSHWNWQLYAGGTIVWAGAWTWFDSFRNDPPSNPSEPSYFARPFTRMHPVYGGSAMTYPDGTVATGFFNNDASDPRNSRVYDAGGSKDIFGHVQLSYGFNSLASASNQPHAGEIWVPESGKFAGFVAFAKDSACPSWTDYARASTLASVQLTGAQGTWTDNLGAWDSFMSGGPVSCAFGEWSVARFRSYLTNHFSLEQLQSWSVLSSNATLADIEVFDVRAYFRSVATNQFGLGSTNLTDPAWNNTGWLEQPVWRAYKIFKRQVGTDALAAYNQAVHTAAAQGGQTNFALLVNDITPACFGWARGTFDLSGTELSLGWNLASGARGFGLPPYGRIAPLYKLVREHGRSRFAGVWLYTDSYPAALTNRGPVEALFYEMLATHTLPQIAAGDAHWAGTPQVQTNFLRFVAQTAAPAFTNRVPVEEVGIYFSSSSVLLEALPGDAVNFSGQDHLYALWGWGTVLSELHYQYRIVPEWKLTPDLLRTLKVLIIPNAVAFEPEDVATLVDWVQAEGGSIIVTGDSGSRLGESGNFDPADSLVLAPLTGVTNYPTAPAGFTNWQGEGVVLFVRSNLGRIYYDGNAGARAALRPSLAAALDSSMSLLGAKPALVSPNAPLTVGLTLYAGQSEPKLFVDLNNLNVDANTFVTTPAPAVDVEVQRPAWMSTDMALKATAISPDGALMLAAPQISGDSVHLRLPSVTNYVSVMLEPAHQLRLLSPAVLADGTFQLTSEYTDGVPIEAGQVTNYEALATTNLLTWTTLSNALTWSNALLLLRDPLASNYSSRFYRLVQHYRGSLQSAASQAADDSW
jgi:hypothetical protein